MLLFYMNEFNVVNPLMALTFRDSILELTVLNCSVFREILFELRNF